MTPLEALADVERFIEAASPDYADGNRQDIADAIRLIDKTLEDTENHTCEDDPEWGEPGDCQARLDNDTDIADTIGNGLTDEEFDAEAIRRGLGRHYGQPHCIYCLEAM